MWPFTKAAPPLERKFTSPSLFVGMGTAQWTARDFRRLAREGYETNPVVYACVTRLAKAIASVDLQLYDHTRQGKLRRIDRHDILGLINAPNMAWSGRQFREKLAIQYLIGGNAFIQANLGDSKPPSELWLLPPEYVTVDAPRGSLLPASYTYRPGNANSQVFPVNQVTGSSSILHLRTANPLDEWYGLPPLVAAAHGVDIFNAGQAWNMALLQNEGRPSGVLKVLPGKDGSASTLTDEQYERLRAMIDDQFSGGSNAGRPMLLEGGLDWSAMSLNAKDMDHRETMLTNARFIAACYGTPPQLVNIPGESTYSNYQQATLAYWSDTVLPLLGLFMEDLSRWLPRLFGSEKCFLWWDEEQIPALEPRRKEKADRINAATYMTPDEKREAMGLEAYVQPPQVGGDSLFVPSNQIPIELAGRVDPNLHPSLAEDEPADTKKPAG